MPSYEDVVCLYDKSPRIEALKLTTDGLETGASQIKDSLELQRFLATSNGLQPVDLISK